MSKRLTYFVLVLTAILLFAGCKNEEFKAYYFQLDEFEDTKVYHFQAEGNRDGEQYIELTSYPDDQALYTKAFDKDLNELSFIKEAFTEEGSVLVTFAFMNYQTDPPSYNYYNVKDNTVYQWDETGPYHYEVTANETAFAYQNIKKNRVFEKEVDLEVMGKTYSTLKFRDTYTFDELIKVDQCSYYAEGLGCVKIEIMDNVEVIQELVLTEILSGGEWAKLLSQH